MLKVADREYLWRGALRNFWLLFHTQVLDVRVGFWWYDRTVWLFPSLCARIFFLTVTSLSWEYSSNSGGVLNFLVLTKDCTIDIIRHFLNIYGDETMDVTTVRQRVASFISGESDVKNKVTFQMEDSYTYLSHQAMKSGSTMDQFISANRRITGQTTVD